MKKSTKIMLAGACALLACGLVLWAMSGHQKGSVSSSAAGTTFNDAKVAAIEWSPATASATSTSLLNNDGRDRAIEDAFLNCNTVGTSFTAYTGTGLANLTVSAATTSTANPATISNSNYVLTTGNNISTTSPFMYTASTTPGLTTSAQNRIWASGSYLSFAANATNTASCLVGVHYLAL